jgi:hypothetical protein
MTEQASSNEQDSNGEASYRVYESLLRPINLTHPQHQGLTRDEFNEALLHPDVVKTAVVHEGETRYLPQLAPIEQFAWLNTPRYQQEFPNSASNGNLLQFTDLPGIEPGDEVNARLRQLADHEGAVVFDYPDTDSDYPDRVAAHLRILGIDFDTVQTLATQTYFAGQVRLKRADAVTGDDLLDMGTTFERLDKKGQYDRSRISNGATVYRTIDQATARAMNDFYDAAYVKLNEIEFCRQGLESDEFMQHVTADQHVLKVVNSVDGKKVALLMLDNDLSELSWVNADYYKQKYPEQYSRGQVMWFPGLAADPNSDVGKNTETMVQLIAELAENSGNEILVVFDCGIFNTGFLDLFLNDMINRTPQASIDIQPIARQHYMAIQTKPRI